jgi:hypothetical protein
VKALKIYIIISVAILFSLPLLGAIKKKPVVTLERVANDALISVLFSKKILASETWYSFVYEDGESFRLFSEGGIPKKYAKKNKMELGQIKFKYVNGRVSQITLRESVIRRCFLDRNLNTLRRFFHTKIEAPMLRNAAVLGLLSKKSACARN